MAATAQVAAVPYATSLGGLGLSCGGKRVTQVLLSLFVERGLQNSSALILDLTENLVRGHLLDQQEQDGVSRFHVRREVLHELIFDTEIGQRAAQCARAGTESHANQRIQEHQSDQQPPKASARG